jgi:peptidoglycan pentaglycine glycine transferase (the first glycine)
MAIVTAAEWDQFLTRYPRAHLLQTGLWGDLKAGFGWEVERLVHGEAGAQVLFRKLPLGLSLAYIPRGPVWGQAGAWYASSSGGSPSGAPVSPAAFQSACGGLLEEIDAVCRRRKAVFLKVEPDVWEAQPAPPPPPGFLPSPQSIQPPRTIVLDLEGDDEAALNRMKQKTRYNVRLALKKGVIVRPTTDLRTFHRMLQITGERDAFGVHSLEYYQRAYDLFAPHGKCELLVAEFEHEPLAALMVFVHGPRAWYFYGASANEHRERMPTYLLQWEAMRWARQQGCTEYDLWGVPDEDESTLEAQFDRRADGLWGVYRFKRGFGGRLIRSAGAWDKVYNAPLYALYRWAVKGMGHPDG